MRSGRASSAMFSPSGWLTYTPSTMASSTVLPKSGSGHFTHSHNSRFISPDCLRWQEENGQRAYPPTPAQATSWQKSGSDNSPALMTAAGSEGQWQRRQGITCTLIPSRGRVAGPTLLSFTPSSTELSTRNAGPNLLNVQLVRGRDSSPVPMTL